MKKRILAILAYMLPTFPLGFVWHLTLFADYYKSLNVYREDMIIPFGAGSMLVQGIVFSIIYEKMFAGERVLSGALKFGAIACPLAWSYMALAASAKHRMDSWSGFLGIETAFVIVHFVVVSPLIAFIYSRKPAT